MTLALAMFSGGLDSMLAARLVMEQGIDVLALQFITPFFGFKAKGREDEAAREFYARYGINVRIVDVTADYLKMIRNPRYGYGKNFNPCLDCKIFLMGRAKVVMQEMGAAFILSGEVLGQRPMSQRRDAMRIVERDSGLDGYLLRPLSAKLLKPTIAEEKGIVDRSRLLDISGRGRTRQMELAARFGITEYPTPAGGCMLTDPILSKRIEKLLAGNEEVAVEDVRLCAAGRHFKLPCGMLYVGRNDHDNSLIESLARTGDHLLHCPDVPGPVSLLRGNPTREDIELASRITARYSDAKGSDQARIAISVKDGAEETITVPAMVEDAMLETLRVEY